MAILDKIRKKQQQATSAPTPTGGQTKAAARLMKAKTGKAAAPAAPISTELERAVTQEAKQPLTQIEQAGRLAATQEGIQQEAQQQEAARRESQVGLQEREVELKREEALANLEQYLEQEAEKLGLSKEAAAAEARLFQRRLADQQYIQNLQQESALKRFEDNANFQQEIAQSQFGHDVSNILLSEKYADLMTDNKLDWSEKMKRMEIDDLISLAEAEANAANKAQMWGGITGLIGTGAKVAQQTEESE
jgi:hypothetical protein